MKEQVVIIEWGDAWSDDDKTTDEAQKSKCIETHTVGFLMSENDEGITICTDLYPVWDPKRGALTNFIPWGMINNFYKVSWV